MKGVFGTAMPVPEVGEVGDVGEVPPAIEGTTAEVELWMQTFTSFRAMRHLIPDIGQDVLWRGFSKIRS